MLKLELLSITELDIKYKYYPEDSDEYGIVQRKIYYYFKKINKRP